MKSRISKTLITLTLAGAGLCNSGCETGMETALLGTGLGALAPYSRTLEGAQSMSTLGAGLQTVGSIQGNIEAAEKGRTQVNVYNIPQPQEQSSRYNAQNMKTQTDTLGNLYTYNKHVDVNEDGYREEKELFGLGKRVFSLNETISVGFYSKTYNGNITFKTWDLSGNLIGKTIGYGLIPNKLIDGYTSPGGPTQGDFLDNLRGAGPGNYKITATLDDTPDKHTYSVDITITE